MLAKWEGEFSATTAKARQREQPNFQPTTSVFGESVRHKCHIHSAVRGWETQAAALLNLGLRITGPYGFRLWMLTKPTTLQTPLVRLNQFSLRTLSYNLTFSDKGSYSLILPVQATKTIGGNRSDIANMECRSKARARNREHQRCHLTHKLELRVSI